MPRRGSLLLKMFFYVIFFLLIFTFLGKESIMAGYTTPCGSSRCVKDGRGCYLQKNYKDCDYLLGPYGPYYSCGSCYWRTVGTCHCSKCGTCCTPVPCKGCTPAVPDGYTDVDNGCKVTITRSCTGDNGCGKSCTVKRTRWLIETNEAETQPASLDMIINGETYSLSTSSTVPTRVKYPSKGATLGDVKISLPSRVVPPTSDGLGYHFRANNYGLNNEWAAYTDCIDSRPEDFCSESTDNVQNFQPSSMNMIDVLKQGAKGKISGMYYTMNRCDDGELYSLPVETYYEVNNMPNTDIGNIDDDNPSGYTPPDICDWNSSLLASDLECVDPETGLREEICSMEPDLDCTKKEFFSNVGTSASTSSKGCYTEDYTGNEVNNPLKIRLGGVDKDGIDEIKGAIVWFDKDGSVPGNSKISEESYTSTNIDDVGIMITQQNGSWNNSPQLYAIQNDNTWGLISDGILKNEKGDRIATVSNLKVTKGIDLVTFELDLSLEFNETGHMGGFYQFKSIILDEYMLLESGNVDQSYLIRHFNWGIDLVNPIMERVTTPVSIKGATEIYLHLEMDGTGSNITDYVLSGYRSGGLVTSRLNLVKPLLNPPAANNSILLRMGNDYPQGCLPGVLGDSDCALNTWHFANINAENYKTEQEEILINIGDNQDGTVVIYATGYDQACNDSIAGHVLDLRPWIATKGGVMYSQGSFGSNAKSFAEEDSPDQYFRTETGDSTLRSYSIDQILNEMTTGTELISSRNETISELIHSTKIKAVRVNNIYDSNEKKEYWFEYFKKKLDQQLLLEGTPIKKFIITGEKVSDADGCSKGDACVMYSEEDIVIPDGYTCDAKTLIMSEGNIRVTPTINSEGEGLEGCIFLAKDRIIIKEGDHLSTGDIVQYDYLEGFFISEDQILIEQVNDLEQVIRDGLEVKGGLVAFGRDSKNSSAILIQRNLRLFSYINPTLVITWDVKYAKLSEIFFGVEAPMYKQEVGFKVF